jgi:hypothetical protein
MEDSKSISQIGMSIDPSKPWADARNQYLDCAWGAEGQKARYKVQCQPP